MLLFSDASCGPCDALMPDVARWQRVHHERLHVALIASGDRERTRTKAQAHALDRVLLQDDREVSATYLAHGTPMGVLIEQGRIASPVAAGADAVFGLIHAGAEARS